MAGAPLLDYALEWLAGAGCVDEVIVVACAHARQVEAHLGAAGWVQPRRPAARVAAAPAPAPAASAAPPGGRAGPATRVSLVACPTARSAGDALRELDVRGTLAGASDFLLLHGDVVTNADLAAALAAHRARRAGPDPGCVATLLVAGGVTPAQRARLGEAAAVYCVDPATGRLLSFDDSPGGGTSGGGGGGGGPPASPPPPAHLRVDARAFGERDALAVRGDLSRPHAALCGPEVLVAFADNFDFQALDADFIPGTLAEEELGHRIYVHVCGGGGGGGGGGAAAYLARATCLRAYDALSRDVLQRWAFPLAPDTNLLPAPSGGGAVDCGGGGAAGAAGSGAAGTPPAPLATAPLATSYRAARQFTYREDGVRVARGAVFGPDAAAGAGASLGEGATVRCSVLGRHASVGRGAQVRGSYLLAGAAVGEGAVVSSSLLCEGAVVGRGAVVGPGVVLGRRCVVAPNTVVPPGHRISLFRRVGAVDGEAGGSTDEEAGEARGGGGGGSGQDSEEDGADEDGFGGGSVAAASASASAPRPPADVEAGAAAAAAGTAPPAALGFDTAVVGAAGAGYSWGPPPDGPAWGLAAPPPPPAPRTPGRGVGAATVSGFAPFGADDGWDSDAAAAGRGGGGGGGARGAGHQGAATTGPAAPLDAEAAADAARAAADAHFRSEVAETFARVAREGISDDNAAIELNSLKIAEDRAFADVASALATAVVALAGPPPPGTPAEDAPLYGPPHPGLEGDKALLGRVRGLLARWAPLLRRFARDEDDQVEVLLALEEWAGGEAGGGAAAKDGGLAAAGPRFAPVWAHLLQALYDGDVLEEPSILAWADEKEGAPPEERAFLDRAAVFVEWLRKADSEGGEEEESE